MCSRVVIRQTTVVALLVCVVLAFGWLSAAAQSSEDLQRAASGRNGMVATAHPLASQAALDILKAGGNAVDAAVAAAFAIGVVEPDGSGLGGGGGMVIYLNETDQSFYINYYQRTPARVNEFSYDPEADRYTGEAVLVPGTVAGLTLALEKFGRLPLSQVIQPAIALAEDGFEVDATLAQLLLDNIEMLQVHEATSEMFLDDGFPKMQGDLLQQPALARTLRIIAEKGRDGFYGGPVAEHIVAKVNDEGGAMDIEDFTTYHAELTKPLEGTYRGYHILSANAPQSGEALIQALNMLENADLKSMGYYTQSAETAHLLAETLRRTYADRWQFLGDPDFNYVPLNGLIAKQFGRERFNDINRYKAEPRDYRTTPAGNPARYDQATQRPLEVTPTEVGRQQSEWSDDDEEVTGSYNEWGENLFDNWGGKKTNTKVKKGTQSEKAKKDSTAVSDDDEDFDDEEFDGHTTHLSVIDKDGNMVSLTQTLGTFFGSGITVDGVLLNCGMSNFSRTSNNNMVEPLKRPRSSITPTVVLKDGKPFCVVGSPGASRIISTVVLTLVNIIDFELNAVEANAAPRMYCQKYEDYLFLEGGFDRDVVTQLERMGHNLRVYEGLDLFFGGVQVIIVDPTTGVYHGSADPRRGGVAFGY